MGDNSITTKGFIERSQGKKPLDVGISAILKWILK
jgi:hypothetical protein